MTATYYYAGKMLDKAFGGVDFDEPEHVYLGICKSCDRDGVVTGEPTVGASAYTRVELDNTASTWVAATNGVITNLNDVYFPKATGDWGTGFDVIFLSDAASGNTHTLVYGDITSLSILTDDRLVFPSGDFQITL